MSRKAMKSSLALTIMGLLLLAYTNCSQPKVSELSENSQSSLNPVNSGLQLSPANITVNWGEGVTISAQGGVAPYYFRLRAGGGSVNTYTGRYTAPSNDTESVIEVEDSVGSVSQTRVFVSLSSSGSMTLSYSPSTINIGSQVSFSAAGGVAPYSYFIVSGPGSVAGNVFTALNSGTVVVGVSDSAGSRSTFSLTVGSTVTINTAVIYRLYNSSAKQYLFSKTTSEGASSGYVNEGGAFKLLTEQRISTLPISRCFISSAPTGRYLSTSGCSSYVNEGTLGYVYAYKEANTTPLYYCFKSTQTTGIYLYTTDYNSCVNNGFDVKSTIGHVPL